MYSPIGKFLRKLRIDNDEILAGMARKIGVSSAFLSAVETGKKSLPADLAVKIAKEYSFSPEQSAEMNKAIEDTVPIIKIQTANLTSNQAQTALTFARTFEDVDDATLEKIRALLSKR